MNGYNFTERVRKVLTIARQESQALRHEYVGTEHILLGLITEGEGVAATALQNLGVDLDDLRYGIQQIVKRGNAYVSSGPDLPYTSRAKKVLELSMAQARKLNHSYVGTEHLLLGLIDEQKGIAAQVLVDRGISLDKAFAEIMRILGTSIDREHAMQEPELTAEQKSAGARILPPSEALVSLVRDAEAIATELFSAEASPVHAAIALLRRGEGFAIAILDRLGCDRDKVLRGLEDIARRRGDDARAEQGAKLDEAMAEFFREMYQPWKMPLGTLDLLLFALDKRPDVAAAFAEQAITPDRVLEEGQRFSG